MGDDVRLLLEGPGGLSGGEDGLPILMFWASKLFCDRVSLGNLSIDSDVPVPWFLNENKINRRRERGGFGENSM